MMRGGTSKGAYFLASDLPEDVAARDRILLSVMGSPDIRQIDGIGGADPLTSKVAIVSRSTRPGIDVDYLFCQVWVDRAEVGTAQNCGNILAGVAPFAIERGLVAGASPETKVTIFMVNSAQTVRATVQTPDGLPIYDGDAAIDGCAGHRRADRIELFGHRRLDVRRAAADGPGRGRGERRGRHLHRQRHAVRGDARGRRRPHRLRDPRRARRGRELKARVEAIRLAVGPMMNLGDVTEKTVPKMVLVAPPREGGAIATRSFIPTRRHATIGVFAALSVATACLLPESPAHDMPVRRPGRPSGCWWNTPAAPARCVWKWTSRTARSR
jgi:4-oxalomesaconate tautomerase